MNYARQIEVTGESFSDASSVDITCLDGNFCAFLIGNDNEFFIMKESGGVVAHSARFSKGNNAISSELVYDDSSFYFMLRSDEVGDRSSPAQRIYLTKTDQDMDPTTFSCENFAAQGFSLSDVTGSVSLLAG